jgi:hypothetical protein
MKKKLNKILLLVLICNKINCQNNAVKIDICNKKAAIANLKMIEANAKQIITSSNDDCVLELLDTLTVLSIKTKEVKYLQTLNEICKISDGYVSEYYIDITEKLVYKNFSVYTSFLALQKDRCLEKFLIQRMSGENQKKEVVKFIDKELKDKIDLKKKNYLLELRKKFI